MYILKILKNIHKYQYINKTINKVITRKGEKIAVEYSDSVRLKEVTAEYRGSLQ